MTSLTHTLDGNDLVISATFDGPMRSLIYRLKPNGWLSIDYVYTIAGPHEYFGVGFDYPEANVKGVRFLGDGPAPVYKNRLAGASLDVWERHYNNTMIGDPDDLKPGERFDYPIFKGFYSGVRWLQLNTSEGPITAVVEQPHDSPMYVQLFTPKIPPPDLVGQVAVPLPTAGVSFLKCHSGDRQQVRRPANHGPVRTGGSWTGEVQRAHQSLLRNAAVAIISTAFLRYGSGLEAVRSND